MKLRLFSIPKINFVFNVFALSYSTLNCFDILRTSIAFVLSIGLPLKHSYFSIFTSKKNKSPFYSFVITSFHDLQTFGLVFLYVAKLKTSSFNIAFFIFSFKSSASFTSKKQTPSYVPTVS